MVAAVGFAAALLSSVFYGTYFVPAKTCEIRDGLAFQWCEPDAFFRRIEC